VKHPEKVPLYPGLKPVKLRCPEGAHRVQGWVYPDGTIELICRQHRLDKAWEMRHLYNPANGEGFSRPVLK